MTAPAPTAAHDDRLARYASPLGERYASDAMLRLWSARERHGLWRRLWLALAEGGTLEVAAPLPPHMRESFAFFGFEAPRTSKPRRLPAGTRR